MDKIQNTKELKSLLSKQSFTVNYYQREYRWGRKQIEQLIDDLSNSFLEYYNGLDTNQKPYEHTATQEIANYGYYYMGSIIRTMGNNNEIIDGQQRLTSITLLLIYLKNLVKGKNDAELATKVAGILDDMIYSDHYGEKTFNIDVPERKDCFTNLFNNNIEFTPQNESSDTMKMRYLDICDVFPDELKGASLIFFIYWLVNKVLFMEIITPTEQDAHKIFVTMNDRGLSLNSAEMLKGYLLSEIINNDDRNTANKIWKEKMAEIKDSSKSETDGVVNTEDVDFIATWIRAKYATTMRDTKKGAEDQDYEIIGREFHQWIRTNHSKINLKNSNDFFSFVVKEMPLYADLYLRLKKYSYNFDKEYEYVFYNTNRDLTYQTMLIFASINKDDDAETINKKIKLVSCFIDQFASIRSFNFKKSNYNSNKDILFKVMNKIRTLSLIDLAKYLIKVIKNMNVTLDGIDRFELNQFTGRYMLHILARFTSFIDEQIGNPNNGTGTMASVEYVGAYTLPANGFTAPQGKQFKGWALTNNGEVITTATYNVTEPITLYAIWEDIPAVNYTISFNANGGTGTMANVEFAGTYTLPTNGFTAPQGKQFKGWSTSATGEVIDGTTINILADTELFAIWEDTQTPPINPDEPEQPQQPEDTNKGLGVGAIIGIVLASLVVLGTSGFALVWFVIKKKKFADLIALFKKK